MTTVFGVVVANSAKLGGRCLAVLDLKESILIRPVSKTAQGELNLKLSSGEWENQHALLEPGDIIEMKLGPANSKSWQRENYYVDEQETRRVVFPARTKFYSELLELQSKVLDAPDYMLADESRYVPSGSVGREKPTLELRLVDDLEFQPKGNGFKGLEAKFSYNSRFYSFPYTGQQDAIKAGTKMPKAFVCLSLGEVFHEAHYKLVAGVLPRLTDEVLGRVTKSKLMEIFRS